MPIFTLRPVSCVALRNNGGSGSVHSFPYFLFRKLSGVKTAGICHKGFLDFTNVERRPPFTIMKGSNYNQPIKIWSLQKWGILAFNNPSFRVNSTFLEAQKTSRSPRGQGLEIITSRSPGFTVSPFCGFSPFSPWLSLQLKIHSSEPFFLKKHTWYTSLVVLCKIQE